MKAYPEYKNSNLDWCPRVPSHWNLASVWTQFKLGRGRVISNEEIMDNQGDYPVYSSQTSNNGEMGRIATYDFDGDYITWTTDGANAGTVFERHGKFNCTNVCGTLLSKNKDLNLSFYKYFLELSAKNFVRHDINPKLMNGVMGAIKIPVISNAEQTKIVDFIERHILPIQQLILEKQSFIKLLQGKRQALISHVVTKGLDDNVKMKPSGVDWIGDIPEHWKVKRYKHLFNIKKRIAGRLGYDVLSITQKGIKVKDVESGQGQLASDYAKYQLVYVGDFAMNHMDLLTGFVDCSKYDGVTSPDYRVFSLKDENNSREYFLYLLQLGYLGRLYYPFGQGVANLGRWRFPTESFNEFFAPVPPSVEQKQIGTYLDKELSKIQNVITETLKSIELLKEHRTALISAAVTGKIDVREAV